MPSLLQLLVVQNLVLSLQMQMLVAAVMAVNFYVDEELIHPVHFYDPSNTGIQVNLFQGGNTAACIYRASHRG